MKLLTEKIYTHSEIGTDPKAFQTIKEFLVDEMAKKISNKIDFSAREIDTTKSSMIATINVMNEAEWKTAKGVLLQIITMHPDVEDEVKRAISIIDPNGIAF